MHEKTFPFHNTKIQITRIEIINMSCMLKTHKQKNLFPSPKTFNNLFDIVCACNKFFFRLQFHKFIMTTVFMVSVFFCLNIL